MDWTHGENETVPYKSTRWELMMEVSVGQVRSSQRLGWMDGVKVTLGNRGMTVEERMTVSRIFRP